MNGGSTLCGSGNSGGSQVVVFGFQNIKMDIANTDNISVAQFFVFDFFAVDEAATPTLVILQKQASVMLDKSRMAFVHRASVQYQRIIFRAAQGADVLCHGKNGAAVVLKAKLIHQNLLAVLGLLNRLWPASAVDYSVQTVKRYGCLMVHCGGIS